MTKETTHINHKTISIIELRPMQKYWHLLEKYSFISCLKLVKQKVHVNDKKNFVVQNVCYKWHKMGVLLYDDDFQTRVCDTFLICVIAEDIINHHITFKVRHLNHITNILLLYCSLSVLIKSIELVCKRDTDQRRADVQMQYEKFTQPVTLYQNEKMFVKA